MLPHSIIDYTNYSSAQFHHVVDSTHSPLPPLTNCQSHIAHAADGGEDYCLI